MRSRGCAPGLLRGGPEQGRRRWPTHAGPEDPLDAALRIAAAFEAARVSYALGGALAYGLWAIPRTTVDVNAQ